MSYKDSMIQQAEQAIDTKRKKRKQLQEDIELLESEENEARAILQLLKTGSAPQMRRGKRVVSKEELLEAISAAGVDGQEFSPGDLAELLSAPASSLAGRLKRYASEDMHVVMVSPGGPGIPSKYKIKE